MVFIGLALGFGTACSPSEETSPPLVGEWAIRIDYRGSGGASANDGIMVFDERIPCYCPADSDLAENAIVGRAYLDLATMGRSPRQTTESYFALGGDGDYYEEVIARVDGRQVVINTRGPAGATFEGLLVDDFIRGRSAYLQHGDTMSAGAFVREDGTSPNTSILPWFVAAVE